MPVDSEQLLYLLYTSGTTAKPKGIMHTTGGYLTQVAWTHKEVFDLKADTDVYWCAADVGWVTGHSYIVYGPLAQRCHVGHVRGHARHAPRVRAPATTRPRGPRTGFWDIIERYGVTQLYTAPTAIRTFMKWGAQEPARHDLSSLRVLGTVGEPINPEAWMWYHRPHRRRALPDRRHVVADRDRRPHDHAAARHHRDQAGLGVRGRCPASAVELVDDARRPGARVGGGYLTITRPWPSMLRGIWGDPERYARHLLVPLRGPLLRRRRRQGRRRRLHLAAGPGRRRHERVRATASPPPRSSPRWSTTPRWPRPPWSAPPTRPPARRSSAT